MRRRYTLRLLCIERGSLERCPLGGGQMNSLGEALARGNWIGDCGYVIKHPSKNDSVLKIHQQLWSKNIHFFICYQRQPVHRIKSVQQLLEHNQVARSNSENNFRVIFVNCKQNICSIFFLGYFVIIVNIIIISFVLIRKRFI